MFSEVLIFLLWSQAIRSSHCHLEGSMCSRVVTSASDALRILCIMVPGSVGESDLGGKQRRKMERQAQQNGAEGSDNMADKQTLLGFFHHQNCR